MSLGALALAWCASACSAGSGEAGEAIGRNASAILPGGSGSSSGSEAQPYYEWRACGTCPFGSTGECEYACEVNTQDPNHPDCVKTDVSECVLDSPGELISAAYDGSTVEGQCITRRGDGAIITYPCAGYPSQAWQVSDGEIYTTTGAGTRCLTTDLTLGACSPGVWTAGADGSLSIPGLCHPNGLCTLTPLCLTAGTPPPVFDGTGAQPLLLLQDCDGSQQQQWHYQDDQTDCVVSNVQVTTTSAFPWTATVSFDTSAPRSMFIDISAVQEPAGGIPANIPQPEMRATANDWHTASTGDGTPSTHHSLTTGNLVPNETGTYLIRGCSDAIVQPASGWANTQCGNYNQACCPGEDATPQACPFYQYEVNGIPQQDECRDNGDGVMTCQFFPSGSVVATTCGMAGQPCCAGNVCYQNSCWAQIGSNTPYCDISGAAQLSATCSPASIVQDCTFDCPSGMYAAEYKYDSQAPCAGSGTTPNSVQCQAMCGSFTACGASCPNGATQKGTTYEPLCQSGDTNTSAMSPNAVYCQAQ